MYNKKSQFIITAMNKQGAIYDTSTSAPEVNTKDCSKRISSAQSIEEAFKAFYQCMLDYLNAQKGNAKAEMEAGWFRMFVELSHDLRTALTNLMRRAIAPLAHQFDHLAPWERFLTIMCSLPIWETISKTTSIMDWRIFEYWSGAFTRMINELGTLIGVALEEVMHDLMLLPLGFDVESFIRFGKKLIETGGKQMVTDLCKAAAAFKAFEEEIGYWPEEDKESAYKDLWDKISTYLTGAGDVVIDSTSKTVSAGLSILTAVGSWIKEHPGQSITLGVLIAIAIALTIGTGGFAAPEAAAGLAWVANALRISVTISMEDLIAIITSQQIPSGV